MKKMTKKQLIAGIDFMYRWLKACEKSCSEFSDKSLMTIDSQYFKGCADVLAGIIEELCDYFGPLA